MEYYDDEISDEEIALLAKLERKKRIKMILIITSIFIVLLAFIIFTIVAYNYNPSSLSDEIIVRNNF